MLPEDVGSQAMGMWSQRALPSALLLYKHSTVPAGSVLSPGFAQLFSLPLPTPKHSTLARELMRSCYPRVASSGSRTPVPHKSPGAKLGTQPHPAHHGAAGIVSLATFPSPI